MVEDCLVRAVQGKLGSGKSVYTVLKAMDALMREEVLVTNVLFDWPAVDAYCRRQRVEVPRRNIRYISTDDIKADPNCLIGQLTEGAMLLIDEVHLILDSRKWQDNAAKADQLQLLMTQARKFKVDMWFISQAAENMDNRILRQCTHIMRCSNWRHLPFLGKLLPFPLTVVRICDSTGRTVLGKEWIWRRPEMFKLYNSHQTFLNMRLGGAKAGKVKGKRKRGVSYAWWAMTLGVIMMALDLWWYRNEVPAQQAETAPATEKKKPVLTYAPLPPLAAPVAVEAVASLEVGRPLHRDVVTRYEATLPRLVVARPFYIVCENYTLRIGSTLGLGHITGWRIEGDCVRCYTDSPEMPELRLFRERNPLICTLGGAAIRRGAGDGSDRNQGYVAQSALVARNPVGVAVPGLPRVKRGPAGAAALPESPAPSQQRLQPAEGVPVAPQRSKGGNGAPAAVAEASQDAREAPPQDGEAVPGPQPSPVAAVGYVAPAANVPGRPSGPESGYVAPPALIPAPAILNP